MKSWFFQRNLITKTFPLKIFGWWLFKTWIPFKRDFNWFYVTCINKNLSEPHLFLYLFLVILFAAFGSWYELLSHPMLMSLKTENFDCFSVLNEKMRNKMIWMVSTLGKGKASCQQHRWRFNQCKTSILWNWSKFMKKHFRFPIQLITFISA